LQLDGFEEEHEEECDDDDDGHQDGHKDHEESKVPMNTTINKDPSRKALGRGLAALIPQPTGAPRDVTAGLREVPVERIQPNRKQPRKVFNEDALDELAGSIRERGVLQPIIVRRRGDGYEIVAGERRWRAATRAGLTTIPVVVKELSDSDALQVALIENLQRRDLDPLEEAEAFRRLIKDYDLSQEVLAEAVGKSRSAIANSLRLLKLPSAVLAMLGDGRLTAGHARALMTLNSEPAIIKLADDIIERGMSVRDAERLARQLITKPKPKEKKSLAEASVEEKLQSSLGTKVHLRNRRGKGKIEIHFHSLEHLNGLIEKLCQ